MRCTHYTYIEGLATQTWTACKTRSFDKVQLIEEIIFFYSIKENFDKKFCLVFQRATECHLYRKSPTNEGLYLLTVMSF